MYLFIHSTESYSTFVPGTVLGAEYTVGNEQDKTTLALWSFQSIGEHRHRELQKHRVKAVTQTWVLYT